MSRYRNALQKQIESSAWEAIRGKIEGLLDNDEEDQLDYLLRFQKVFVYIDNCLSMIDADLVPYSKWGDFEQQVNSINQLLGQASSAGAINPNQLQQLNNGFDALLTLVSPYLVQSYVGVESHVEAHVQTIKSQDQKASKLLSSLNKKSNSLDEILEEAQAKIKELINIEERAVNFDHNVFGSEDTEGRKEEVIRQVDELKSIHNKAKELEISLIVGDENTSSVQNEVNISKRDIEQKRDTIKNLLSDTETKLEDLQKFYIEVYGDGENEEGGLKKEIDDRFEGLDKYEAEQKNRIRNLDSQIESLLDGATNAGLASAYQKMKISFDRPIFWSTAAFVASICAIVGVSWYFAITPNGDATLTVDYMLTTFVTRLPFYLPLIWLAVFTSKRRSEYSRLQQEYG